MGGRAIPRAKRSRRQIPPTFRAKPSIPQGRLIYPPEYVAYKKRRKELGL